MKSLDINNITRLKSMLSLLDDEDDSIYRQIKKSLISLGESALPHLDDYLNTSNTLLNERVREAYDLILIESIQEQFRAFRGRFPADVDLEEGVFLISHFGYPQADMRIYSDLLNFFASELQPRLDPLDAPEDTVQKIGRYFTTDKGFGDVEKDYYNPESHYFTKVLETKRGVPIALSAIYLLVLRKLNIPVRGIGMPGHFIIRYAFETQPILADPSNGGRILSTEDCKDYLVKMGYQYNESYLEPVNNKQILERMLRNLVLVYEKQSQPSKVQGILQCIDILNSIV